MKKFTAFMLCLFLVLSVLAVSLAEGAETAAVEEFVAPNIVPAKGIEEFIGEWVFDRIMLPDGIVHTREDVMAEAAEDGEDEDVVDITITISEKDVSFHAHVAGDLGPYQYEFIPESGSLKVNVEDQGLVVTLCLTDNGMLYYSEAKGDVEKETVYFIRKEEVKASRE